MHPSYQECVDAAACPVCHAPRGIWCATGQDLHIGRIRLYNRIAALRDAAERGWSDLASGRYDDIADENLDDFIGQLEAGARSAQAAPADAAYFDGLRSRIRREHPE
ncbi:MAG TPA: hypothetical protein VMQ10_13280 [Spirochaetia bacterium]|nr:hypothetical protein [Spirochaetia bacterium]